MQSNPSENTSLTANITKSFNGQAAAEIEKWKKFGYLMAESYDELKKENEKIKQEREKDRKIVHALKDQVDKLKLIIKAKKVDDKADFTLELETLKNEVKEKDSIIEELKRQI